MSMPSLESVRTFEETGGMFRLTYNERITQVATGAHGLPTAWTWRGRRYAGGALIKRWVTTGGVVARPRSPGARAPASIQHFVLHASSEHDTGQMELAHDDATMTWRLIGILGEPSGS
jgi:hypothetical protein